MLRLPRPAPRALGRTAAAVALALVATSCGSSVAQRLVVADASTSERAGSGVRLFAVDPGEPVDDGDVIASGLTGGASIRTVDAEGAVRNDEVATAWNGRALVAGTADAGTLVTTAVPGQRPTLLNGRGEARTTVLDVGVLVETERGCSLTRPDGRTSRLGTGRCSLSEDQRWVATWPFEGGEMRIFDLRAGSSVKVPNLRVGGIAVALGRDRRVLAQVGVGEQSRLVMIDAETGKVVGRTPVVDSVGRIDPKSVGEPGFAVTVRRGSTSTLWFVGTDAAVTEVATGPLLFTVSTHGAVVYLRYDEEIGRGRVVRLSDRGTSTVLARGKVGAGPVGTEHVVVTEETRTGVEVRVARTDAGPAEEFARVPAPRGQVLATGATVDQVLTIDGVAWMTLSTGGRTSLVRLHLDELEGETVIADWELLVLQGTDADGTALVSGARRGGATGEAAVRIMTVRTDAEEPTTRLTVQRPTPALIHDGAIYLATAEADRPVVSRVAPGATTAEVIYRGVQLAGSLWPNQGGATTSTVVTPTLLVQQAQVGQEGLGG